MTSPMFFSHKFRCNYNAILLDAIIEDINKSLAERQIQEGYFMVVFTDDPHAFFFTHQKEVEKCFLDLLRENDLSQDTITALDMHRVVSPSTCQEKRIVGSYELFKKIA